MQLCNVEEERSQPSGEIMVLSESQQPAKSKLIMSEERLVFNDASNGYVNKLEDNEQNISSSSSLPSDYNCSPSKYGAELRNVIEPENISERR